MNFITFLLSVWLVGIFVVFGILIVRAAVLGVSAGRNGTAIDLRRINGHHPTLVLFAWPVFAGLLIKKTLDERA